MSQIHGYAAQNNKDPLAPFTFERRKVRPHDIKIEILYCGVCHSDLHTVRNEWRGTTYPCVPGHEIVGKVSAVGSEATRFQVGDLVAVGCMVDSCRTCSNCKEGLEQYCEPGAVFTYNGKDKVDGTTTYGGYSTQVVVDEDFVLKIPSKFTAKDLPGVAPLLCAGITTYSPLKHWKIGKSSKVGVVGLGGLGHMAIKLAHAMGAYVVVFTSHESKIAEAKRLGANECLVSKKTSSFESQKETFDFIIDTVSATHNLDPYMELLKRDGVMCMVGAPEFPHPSPTIHNMIFKRRSLAGSLIGGIKETQEVLDFCAEHGITSDVEIIPIDKINESYERMLAGDVKYRFVIDIASLKH
jgi:uncharacterized zinc-type alcohol dehydrogenase-like protein